MLRRSLFIFALVGSLVACGQEQKANTPTAAASIPSAKYPKDLPASTLDDTRLVGYWETKCELSTSGSLRWTFLLDPTKAVLEKQLYHDTLCEQAVYTLRYYLSYDAGAEKFEGRIWEVHAHIQATDRLTAFFPSPDCPLPTVRDDIWYDLTGSACRLPDALAPFERGSSLISSRYGIGLNHRQLLITVAGQVGLNFARID